MLEDGMKQMAFRGVAAQLSRIPALLLLDAVLRHWPVISD